jgi:hypothetical protein
VDLLEVQISIGVFARIKKMGDRFYMQQKNHKPKRRLKKDIIAELDDVLGTHIEGMDRLTIKTLDKLIEHIRWKNEN